VLKDPGRSSAPSPAAAEQAFSTREVSPRDLVERVLAGRADVAAELAGDLARVQTANAAILRAALALTMGGAPTKEEDGREG